MKDKIPVTVWYIFGVLALVTVIAGIEEGPKGLGPSDWEDLGHQPPVQRLEVPGGWLYQVRGPAGNTVFVPHPDDDNDNDNDPLR